MPTGDVTIMGCQWNSCKKLACRKGKQYNFINKFDNKWHEKESWIKKYCTNPQQRSYQS